MKLSPTARAGLIGVAVVGLLAYGAIVELGVNAGLVHYGVTVGNDVDLSRLSRDAATEALRARVDDLTSEPVVFGMKGVGREVVYPSEIGWRPRVDHTVAVAMEVGRSDGMLAALGQRMQAWFGGVNVQWADKTKATRVTEIIDRVEARARQAGLTLDRGRFRYKIRTKILSWPRKDLYLLPVERS